MTEAISQAVREQNLISPVGSYRLFAEKGTDQDLGLMMLPIDRDSSLGSLQIPPRFRHLDPQARAGLIADAIEAALLLLASHAGWDAQIVKDCVQRTRDAQFSCEWVGPWKLARDRKSRVRLQGRILDDGYGRWRIAVADPTSTDPRLLTEERLGWTWLSNFERASKSMRFLSPTVLELAVGSDTLPEPIQVDILTGAIRGQSHDPRPTSYPGDARRSPERPHLRVGSHVPN